MERRKSKQILCGRIKIGGDAPITVQTMLNFPPQKVEENVRAAQRMEQAGCDILRIAVPDEAGVALVRALKEAVRMPIVADIHFDYRLAIAAVEAGCDKVRINPGNIGGEDRVRQVAECCRSHGVPIRIGVNGGSLQKDILQKYGAPTAAALCESALRHAALLEQFDFTDIVLSLKSSDVPTMLEAYRMIAKRCDYPLHLGVTETGTEAQGIVKSAVGIGALLADGIGDTIRVSLTADPAREVEAGLRILRALNLRRDGINLISCPTCGRTKSDLIGLVQQAERRLAQEGLQSLPLTVAIMGCAVNGPGEAREADVGLACGESAGVLFRRGEKLRSVPMDHALDALLEEIRKLKED